MTKADETHFVPLDEITAVTGLGPIQAKRDIRDGYLPGEIRRNKIFVQRSLWNQYLEGTWARRPTRNPVGIVSIHEKAS